MKKDGNAKPKSTRSTRWAASKQAACGGELARAVSYKRIRGASPSLGYYRI